jgi:hypothetical protein
MPKKPPRNNRQSGNPRTVHSAATLLQRINLKAAGPAPYVSRAGAGPDGTSDSLLIGIQKLLPLTLAPHLVTCLEKPDELVLFADSAAWAGRLKLALAETPTVGAGRKVTVRVQGR